MNYYCCFISFSSPVTKGKYADNSQSRQHVRDI